MSTPTPPTDFGSYAPDEVTWLLTDLSGVELELETGERERIIQTGGHYSEMLPVEFHPDAAYTELFKESLGESARRLALAVALVGELVWRRHERLGTTPVLVSLARAGTPVGVLLRRYFQAKKGMDVPHYAISIIRGKGIDTVALAHMLENHEPEQLRFVDGWTGKGAITRELTEALATAALTDPRVGRVDPELAVLADPASCTTLYGTRDDFLIPSACLNSTVSGLVSRTVLRDDLIGPGMYHGAKFYRELADADVSNLFLDVVAAQFEHLELSDADVDAFEASDRTPHWSGWEVVEHLGSVHGITNVHLIKPGVGETTRVLLRRVPWKVLVRPDRADDVRHVRMLAEARGVPVVEDPDLPYSCVGLIAPHEADQ